MSSRYAATTEVPIDRSRGEIERIVTKHGATSYAYGWQDANAVITFDLKGRRYRFHVPLPDRGAREFNFTEGRGTRRTATAAAELWTQACRARWRALALIIKAKFVAVEDGIVSIEEEFMPYVVLPNGRTVADEARPAIEAAYATGQMRPILALPSGGDR
jgi:hypothetical protein